MADRKYANEELEEHNGYFETGQRATPNYNMPAPGPTGNTGPVNAQGVPYGNAGPPGAWGSGNVNSNQVHNPDNQLKNNDSKMNREGPMNYAGYQGMYGSNYGPGQYGSYDNYAPGNEHHQEHPHHYYYHQGYGPNVGGGANYGMNQPNPGYGGANYNMYQGRYGYQPMSLWQSLWNPYGASYGMNNPYGTRPMGFWQNPFSPGNYSYGANYGGAGYGMSQPAPGYGNPYGYQPMGFWPNIFAPGYFSYLLRGPRVNNFFRAVGIVTVGMLLVPSVARALRPLAVSAVEGALSVSEEIKNIFADAKEDMEDIFAEAKWEDVKAETASDGNKS